MSCTSWWMKHIHNAHDMESHRMPFPRGLFLCLINIPIKLRSIGPVTWSAQEQYFAIQPPPPPPPPPPPTHTHTHKIPDELFAKEMRKRKQRIHQREKLQERKPPPSLRSMTQSSQAWKSLAIFPVSYATDPVYFAKIHPPFILLLTDMDSEIKKNLFPRSYTQHSRDVPDCSLCDILQISWNPFIKFP